MRRSFMVIVVLMLALFVLGCGDDDNVEQVQRRGGASDETVKEEKFEELPPIKVVKNETWEPIRPFFLGNKKDPATGYVRKALGGIRDPFEPQLVKFVPRIEIMSETGMEQPDGGGDADPAPELVENVPQPVELGPTQKYRAQDYTPLLIRWGTSVNKALVADPTGKTFIITKDMKLGSNNGRVTEITRYEVWVQEDDREEPIALSIEPQLLRIGTVLDGQDQLFPILKDN